MIHTWKINENVVAGTTLRHPGHSLAPFDSLNMAFYVGDNQEHVIANRALIASQTPIPLTHWVFPKMTHSDHWVKVDHTHAGMGAHTESTSIMDCDALYTQQPHLMLAVFHADCTPLLLFDPQTQTIGAIHAGWVGTLKAITKKMIDHWVQVENIDPKNIKVYIGPSISQKNFEVGYEVVHQVITHHKHYLPYLKIDDMRSSMDVSGINVQQCLDAGVLLENITHLNACSFECEDKYFSFRKQAVTGRNVSFIGLK